MATQAEPQQFFRSSSLKGRETPSSEPSQSYRAIYNKRDQSKFTDPCEQARDNSMTCDHFHSETPAMQPDTAHHRCLDVNAYDRTKCTAYFEAFRECKKRWMNQRREDRMKGRA